MLGFRRKCKNIFIDINIIGIGMERISIKVASCLNKGEMVMNSVLARIWIFFPKKELLKFFSELFAKERSYSSRAKIVR